MLTDSIAKFGNPRIRECGTWYWMRAITGDTGAGKSLILGALELALGGRADTGLVRSGTERAQISARFDITQLHRVRRMVDGVQPLKDNSFTDASDVRGALKALRQRDAHFSIATHRLSNNSCFFIRSMPAGNSFKTRHQLELRMAMADKN